MHPCRAQSSEKMGDKMLTPTNSGEIGDGASTGAVHDNTRERDKEWKTRKLVGGVRIPYPAKMKAKVITQPEAVRMPVVFKPSFTPNIPAVECGICFSPVKEATVPKCGHVYCHDCIENWSHVRSWCPICQEAVHPLIRIYSIDEQIEKYYLKDLSKEERLEFEEATARRMKEHLLSAQREKRFMNRMVKKCRNMKLYFQSKGFFHGIGRQGTRAWLALKRVNFLSMHLLLGLFLGFILASLCFTFFGTFNLLHFLRYMWNAIKNYSGNWVPEDVKTGPLEPPPKCAPDDMDCGKKLFLKIKTPTPRVSSSDTHNLFAAVGSGIKKLVSRIFDKK